ncbi:cell wall anchor protein [Capnocytophaga canis]|uniref:cell wall anchor protein n=1 Tax=Capnocytophaga canis TaxID=1848903 RepID=UPI001561DDD2|nr:cell wall anchor protein [Capnocytophaga canis]
MFEFIQEHLVALIASFISGLAGWFFGRPKEKIELQGGELDNVDKAVEIYRKMIEDLRGQLLIAIEELGEARKTIKELESTVESLTDELKKYKQLNGKSK